MDFYGIDGIFFVVNGDTSIAHQYDDFLNEEDTYVHCLVAWRWFRTCQSSFGLEESLLLAAYHLWTPRGRRRTILTISCCGQLIYRSVWWFYGMGSLYSLLEASGDMYFCAWLCEKGDKLIYRLKIIFFFIITYCVMNRDLFSCILIIFCILSMCKC